MMRGLGARLGPMFLQLPPRFPPHLIGELRPFWPPGRRMCAWRWRSATWIGSNRRIQEELNRASLGLQHGPRHDRHASDPGSGRGRDSGGDHLRKSGRRPGTETRCPRNSDPNGGLCLHPLHWSSRSAVQRSIFG